jgi:hypothetical protein
MQIFTHVPMLEHVQEFQTPEFFVKYYPLKHVRHHPLIRFVTDLMPIRGDRDGRHVLIDYKVQRLELGEATCIPGWHLDTIQDPDAIHHLAIIGHNRTEFLIDGKMHRLPENSIATYGTDVYHRGPVVEVPETRILIRVTESKKMRPRFEMRSEYPNKFQIGGPEDVRIQSFRGQAGYRRAS